MADTIPITTEMRDDIIVTREQLNERMEDYVARDGGDATMPSRSTESSVKIATHESVQGAEMRAARLARIGELAVAWRKASKLADLCEHEDDKDPDLGRLWRAQDDAYLALIKACDEVKP